MRSSSGALAGHREWQFTDQGGVRRCTVSVDHPSGELAIRLSGLVEWATPPAVTLVLSRNRSIATPVALGSAVREVAPGVFECRDVTIQNRDVVVRLGAPPASAGPLADALLDAELIVESADDDNLLRICLCEAD